MATRKDDYLPTYQVCELLGLKRHQLQWLLLMVAWRPKQVVVAGRRTNLYTHAQVEALAKGLGQMRGALGAPRST